MIALLIISAAMLLISVGLITVSLKTVVTQGSNTPITKTVDYSADSRIQIDMSVAAGASDITHDIAFDKDRLQFISLVSDQDITLETNSSSSPADTISLLANVPFVWADDGYIAVPFSADVTKFYWTNASGSAASIKGEILWDATP